MSQVSVSGIVSGVDTASLINSLVSVQQNQQTLLKNQQSQQQKAADTYANLITSLGTLSTLAKGIAKTSDWKGATASSSSTGVTATVTGTQASALSFDVTSLARAHALVSHEAVGSLNSPVASGPLTITKGDGSTVEVPTGTGSLADVVAAVNASSAGVTASAVQTAPGQFRLQLTAGKTGESSEFAVTGFSGFTAMDVLTRASDAEITLGSDPLTAYTVRSTTNTFANVVPGVSFTVSRLETGVSIGSTVDGSAVADDVQKLVDAANDVLSAVATATQWNATTKTGGSLVGDSTARTLQQSILGLVGSAGAPGISLNRNGKLTFDRDAFSTAFVKDPTAIAARFGAGASFTPASGVTGGVSYSSATSTTTAGSYDVHISSLATIEQWKAPTSGSLTAGQVLTLTKGSLTASYTVAAADTLADVTTGLNQAAAAAGLPISGTVSGTDLLFSAGSAGSAGSFILSLDSVAQTEVVGGADVAGTIDGQTGVGSGSVLSLPEGTGGAKGLAVNVLVSQAEVTASGGDIGTIAYAPGLAQRFLQLADQQTATGTGVLSTAKTGRESAVRTLQSQIDDWDRRLTSYRASLQAQFTAMETAMATLKSQSSFLSSYSSTQSSSKQ
ncbi:MAG: flagellar filament capping protein FliD [Kineosporiaceae bacterium]